jgi:Ankyrin repeats (3 copies)
MRHSSGMARLQKRLLKYAAEHRAGFRQGSVLSFRTGATTDSLNDWDEVKRELEDVGVSPLAVDEHREYIRTWLQEAIEAGAMEEDPNLVHGSPSGSMIALPQLESLSLETASAPLPSQLSESGEGMSRLSTRLSSEPTLVNESLDARREKLLASQPTLANQIFDAKWLELRDETGQEPDVPPSLIPTTKRRKSSQLGSLIHKLLKSDQKIIQAASDGNAAEVERLLSVGVNVNTKDKWGWTAMSMAAYGGHVEVARVLISHGATLDHQDVDEDTPLTLARNKGHRTLVMMIEEETTRRAMEEG